MSDLVIEKIQASIKAASETLVERRLLFELVVLGLITNEHVLFIGPPGTGKSAAVQKAAQQFSGAYFEYLVGRFTEPSEIFGPLDLAALKQGEVRPVTANMLPEANIVFLDEIFLGSTAILNTLLGVLNERVYKRGTFCCKVPLWSCVAASNALPDDPMLQAFADRFLLTSFVEPVKEDSLTRLLNAGWNHIVDELAGEQADPSLQLNEQDLGTLTRKLTEVDLHEIYEAYAHIIRKMRVRGLTLSDRRLIKGQKLIAAAAMLAGRKTASVQDLWPVIYLVQDQTLQAEVQDLLANELSEGENRVLTESVKTATLGPKAHAQDLIDHGTRLLNDKPGLATDPAYEIWQVKVESLLTRIDAGFSGDDMPHGLDVLRAGLTAATTQTVQESTDHG